MLCDEERCDVCGCVVDREYEERAILFDKLEELICDFQKLKDREAIISIAERRSLWNAERGSITFPICFDLDKGENSERIEDF
jgi:hypothetical protein